LAYGCFLGKKTERFSKIDSIFSVKSKVSYFKVVEKNQGISYGHTYVTKNATRIVTIPIGYGDGYLRGLSNKGNVLINGKKYRIVGNICMDSFMVELLIFAILFLTKFYALSTKGYREFIKNRLKKHG